MSTNDRSVDAYLQKFRDQWRSDRRPKISDFIDAVSPPNRDSICLHLVAVEIQLRLEAGEEVRVEEYAELGAAAAEHAQQVLDTCSGNRDLSTLAPLPTQGGRATAKFASSVAAEQSLSDGLLDHESQIGPYKILKSIGSGGMGQVFLAEQLRPVRRQVALKIIRTDAPTEEILARFEAERQALAMMDHQNIAKVFDAGVTDNGRPYFAMELVKGKPIIEYCDRNRLNLKERLSLFVQTCRAIQHAHSKGIIHRDIKPSNVLVAFYEGVPIVKVIDFGLAKALEETTQLTDRTLFTMHGQVVGTLAYMSPEQAGADVLGVDTRTDVYSLGVILYELLTGSTPLPLETIRKQAFDRILTLIREADAVRPSQRLSDSGEAISQISESRRTEPNRLSIILKGDLDWIAVKALEKDRTRRYDTASALADDVQRYLDDEAVEARPPSVRYRFSKAYRKHRIKFWVAATLLGMLVAGLAGTGTMWYRASLAEKSARKAEGKAGLEAIAARLAEQQERDARTQAEAQRNRANAEAKRAADSEAYVSLQLANARWDANRVAEARAQLDLIPDEYRGFEWWLSQHRFLGSDMTLYGHASPVALVAYGPDGGKVASLDYREELRIWDTESGQLLQTIRTHEQMVNDMQFAPDGKTIATASDDQTIRFWDVETGQRVSTFEGHADAVLCFDFSPDGKQLISCALDGQMSLWEVAGGEREILSKEEGTNSVTFHPDGNQFVSCTDEGIIKIWDLAANQVSTTINWDGGNPNLIYFSPDGKYLAWQASAADIQLLNLSTEQVTSLGGPNGRLLCFDFSPDGSKIVAGSANSSIQIWDVHRAAVIRTLKGHSQEVLSVAFSPRGDRILSGSNDNSVKVWDATRPEGAAAFPSASHKISDLAFTAEGHILAIANDSDSGLIVVDANGALIEVPNLENTIDMLDAETGELIRSLVGHTRGITSLDISPDSKSLVSSSIDGSVRLWNLRTGEFQRTLMGHSGRVESAAFSLDGTQVISAGWDETIRIWDAFSGQLLVTLKGDGGPFNYAVSNPDGTSIASIGMDTKLRVWDVSSKSERYAIDHALGQFSSGLEFSPDGKQIAANDQESISLWNAETGEIELQIRGRNFLSFAFSPDGARIASCSVEGTVEVWDASTGQELIAIDGLGQAVRSVSFSPAGQRLAAGTDAGNLFLWNARQRTEASIFRGHQFDVRSVAISEDGKTIFSEAVETAVGLLDSGPIQARPSERFVWDAERKLLIANAKWNPPAWSQTTSQDGRWLVTNDGQNVVLVDQNYQRRSDVRNNRKAKNSVKSSWHLQQASSARKERNWFSATFHAAWMLIGNSNSRPAYEALHKALDKIDASEKQRLPAVVRLAAAMPQPAKTKIPKLSVETAESINAWVWRQVSSAGSTLSEEDLDTIVAVVRDHPRGVFFNTLGVAQFRAGNLKASIEACSRSLELTPAELDLGAEHPVDLAILAMSNHLLGRKRLAKQYYKQFQTNIELSPFKSDRDCLSFATELNALLETLEKDID